MVPLQKDQFGHIVQDTYQERAFRAEYDDDDNPIYIGYAQVGAAEDEAVWQIQKRDYDTSNHESTTWPELDSKASRSYSFVWEDRATYTYS